MMDIHEILKRLPHRYPFLLVDRVLELETGKRIRALKNVTINEPFFTGHFPYRPVMHHRTIRKVAGEEGFVDRDVLQRADAFAGFQFQHPVHKQEGVTMRKPFEDLVNVHHDAVPWFLWLAGFEFSSALRRSRNL